MVKYGQTWWGGEWLKALSHIDYSNRLPRGRNYANKGAVTEITIKGRSIHALVQGTRRNPYKVTVKTPGFTDDEKNQLTGAIMENPLLLSRLLNRDLPPQLHRIATARNILIFPRRWDDLEMKCSCPDWAVPCKHLAAVINVIANEIDRNPFLVFKLHDFDIPSELRKKGLDAVNETVDIPDASRIFEEEPVNLTADYHTGHEPAEDYHTGHEPAEDYHAGHEPAEDYHAGHEPAADFHAGKRHAKNHHTKDHQPGLHHDPGVATLPTIDFSEIPNMRENILALLPEKPLFHPSDFKAVIENLFKKTSKHISRQLRLENEPEENGVNYEKYTEARVETGKNAFFSSCLLTGDRLTGEEAILTRSPEELVTFLSAIPPKFINRLSPGPAFLYFTWLFARTLVLQSAFIPQIMRVDRGNCIIRWIPALIDDSVKKVLNALVNACPPSLTLSGKSTQLIKREEQVNILVSTFIKHYIHEAGYDDNLRKEPASKMFVADYKYPFDGPGEKEIPFTIQRWTDRLYLTKNKYIPVLEITGDQDTGSFRVNVLVENREEPLKEPVALKDVMTLPEYGETRIEVLRNLDLLTSSFPALENTISSAGNSIPIFNPDEFAGVLFKILPLIKLYGIRIILPAELKSLVRPKASLALSSTAPAISRSFLNLEKILEFRWKIALGDLLMDKDEFLKLVKGLSGVVKIKNRYVYLNPLDLKALMESVAGQERLNRNQLLQTAITGEYNGAVISIDSQTKQLIALLLQVTDIDLPEGLSANFRPYQKRGYDWLFRNTQLGFGSIIADDMGLGKTLQVISIIQKLRNEGELEKHKALIIVPTTLITNWQKEIDKFAPGITYSVYHGPNRQLNTGTDIVITSYGISRSDNEFLSGFRWKMVVIDEAQNIKNPGTAQTKAVKKLKADIRIAMSGTPVENRLSEYWSIFDFTIKGYLGNLKHFIEEYAVPIELSRNKSKLDRFLKITGPFILRRLKTDKSIISDLPDKIENDYFASLTGEQAAIYQNVLDTIITEIENVETDEKGGAIERRGLVLKLILALKQICNHPSQYLKKESASPDLSGKAGLFIDLVENIIENDEKVLVFTQFREMGELLQKMIKQRFDTGSMFLHGGTPRKHRDEMVDRFQNDPHEKIFLLSIKAGGTGLNLTAANHVVHYDLWWNPAVESQATDRAYRIGQKNNVMVYRLITRGTFEEKINAMLADKKDLANLTLATGEKWIGELTNSELRDIFTFEA